MINWFVFIVLGLITILAGLWPIWRRWENQEQIDIDSESATFNSNVYKDQLSEIDTDLERGIINTEDAQAAKTEISRKLLAAAETASPDAKSTSKSVAGKSARKKSGSKALKTPSPSAPYWKTLIAGLPVLAISLITYDLIGEPGRNDLPLQARMQPLTPAQKEVAELISKVEAQLAKNPEDKKGWDVLAPVLLREKQYAKAAHAFRQAIRLNGANVKRLTSKGEAIVFLNKGMVTPEAEEAYKQALKLDPMMVVPRIRLAMAKEQQSDFKAAGDAYTKILYLSGKEAPWVASIKQRLAFIQSKLGNSGNASTMAALPRGSSIGTTPSAGNSATPGPTAEDVKAASKMSASDRNEMINQMVSRLAEKLEENGKDLNGWMRLMRAYKVLGNNSKAREALHKAREHFKAEPNAIAQLAQTAKSLGIGS